jgi:hypothetical protein
VSEAYAVVVIGGGPAAFVAARLLASLDVRTLLVAPPPPAFDAAFAPHILLPASALDALGALGLRARIEAAGTEIRSNEVRWPGPDPAPVPGRSSGLVVSEPELARHLLDGASGSSVTQRHARALAVEMENGGDGTRVTGVHLDPSGTVRTGVVLSAVGGLLPPACRARAAGPADIAQTCFLAGVDRSRFPIGHHYVSCEAERWSWALRHPTDTVQLTTFAAAANSSERAAPAAALGATSAPDDFPSAFVAASIPARDATPTVPGPGPWPAGLFAIGRALYRVAPASSLGTAQAVRGARAAVAAAHAIVEGSVDAHAAASWHVDAAVARAARTHALTADAYRSPCARFGSAFWRARAEDAWVQGLDPAIVRSALAARRVLSAMADDAFLDAPLVAASPVASARTLAERGPRLVDQRAVAAPGGRTLGEDLWASLVPVARAFGIADPLAARERGGAAAREWRTPARTLRELLASADPDIAQDPKRTRRSLGALVEAGFLAFADDRGETPGTEH